MFDLGWTEMLVIGIVALIVIGPKDLPVMFRTLGQFVGKAKGMAREFSRAMNDAADDAGAATVTIHNHGRGGDFGVLSFPQRRRGRVIHHTTTNDGYPKVQRS